MSRPSFFTRQLSVICPLTICSPYAERPSTIHSTASTSAPEETSISVFLQMRAVLKRIVSCGSHDSLAAVRIL